jgi:hypothetical protein
VATGNLVEAGNRSVIQARMGEWGLEFWAILLFLVLQRRSRACCSCINLEAQQDYLVGSY